MSTRRSRSSPRSAAASAAFRDEARRRDGAPLDLAALSHPDLTELRAELIDRVIELCADEAAALRALKLGPRLVNEVEHNRRLRTAPTMPALDRFTGVLFDALDASSLSAEARRFAAETTFVHSALFGLLGALDPIPAYRLSHDSRIPGISLRRYWRDAISTRIREHAGWSSTCGRRRTRISARPRRDRAACSFAWSPSAARPASCAEPFQQAGQGSLHAAMLESRPTIT